MEDHRKRRRAGLREERMKIPGMSEVPSLLTPKQPAITKLDVPAYNVADRCA
jgi:hypothetical protein